MIVFLFFLSLVAFEARSVESETTGKVWFSELRRTDNVIDDKTQSQGGVFLKNQTDLNEHFTFKTELLGYYIQSPLLITPNKNLNRGDHFFEANESYLRYENEGLTLKAGQQTTFWGKSDGLNPTDFLTGRRNILLGAEDLQTRRGHLSTVFEFIPNHGNSPWNFQQWVVFQHSTTDVLINSRLTGGFVELESESRNRNMELASKISYQGSGFEIEYIYFHGANKTPLFFENSRSNLPTSVSLTPQYVRQEAHGVNLVKDFKDYILRFEGAYVRRFGVEDSDFLKNPERVDVVLGVEKSFYESHRINMQLVGHHFLNYRENTIQDLILERIQLFNRILQAQHQQSRLGYLLAYQYEPSEMNQLKFKMTWLNYLYQESAYVISPQIDYEFSSEIRAQLFALIFGGENRTPFGVLKDLSSLGLNLNYNF